MKPQDDAPTGIREPGETSTVFPVVTSGSQRQHRLAFLRGMLLREAAQASSQGLPVHTFHLAVRLHGLDVSVADVERELQYLLDKNLLVSVPKVISPEIGSYRIHANGRDFLAMQGFED